LNKEAGIIVGVRPHEDIMQFSFLKKSLQKVGSWAVSKVSGLDIPDAPSEFRAFSRGAARRLNAFIEYI
jgi:hypothetical protein